MTVATTTPTVSQTRSYNHAIGYLRAFVVILVIAHHVALAWIPVAPRPKPDLLVHPRTWLTIPVVDTVHLAGSLLFITFNDIFFMSLMFFLSGLFFWHGLSRKGLVRFLRDRLLRLGLPLAVSVALLSAIAYYPSYLQTTTHTGFAGFVHQWITLGVWPTGPAWFVGVLLVFDCVAAVFFTLAHPAGDALARFTQRLAPSPARFFAAMVALTAALYIPMALAFTAYKWSAWGPLAFQTSRILHYFAYFVVAIGIGATGLDRGLLAPTGKLPHQWALWCIAAIVAYAAITVATFSRAPHIAIYLLWTVSCAASSFALLAIFLRFIRRPRTIGDSLAQNSYAI